MRFKSSSIFSNTTILENEIVQLLWTYGRADANLQQVWLGVNYLSKRKYILHKPRISEALLSLVKKDIVVEKEYKGGLKHYLLKNYLTKDERGVYE